MQDTIDDLGGLAADDELRSLIAGSRAPAKDPSWADMGFSRLTDSDLDWADAQLDRPVGVAEGFTPEWGDVPLGGYGYTLQRLLDVKQSLARMQSGKAELEDEQEVMRWMVNEARAKTPGGTVGELFRGMATFGAEFLVSGGVASAAKGASKKALSSLLKQSIEEGAEKATVGFLGKAGTTLALQEVPHQIAGAAGLGPGGGAITAQAVQSVMGREMSLEEAESVAEDWRAGLPLLLGMAGDDIEGRFGTPELGTVGGMINGLLRQGIEVGAEGAGGALSKLPVVKQFDTLMGGLFKTLEGRAGKVGWGQAIREAAELSGPGGEVAEEYLASVTSALVMGDQTVEEAVAEVADITPEMLVAFSILPGAQSAAGRFAGPTLQDQIDLMEKQAASADPAEGGDPVSTDTPEGVTESPASEGVPTPEQRTADVAAFARDIQQESGREVAFEQVEAETPAQKMAQRALRRRGIDPTFVTAEDSDGLPAGYFPGEGRAVVRADSPDVLGAAVHEAIHTWAVQQEDTAAAVKQELDALRGKDARFVEGMRNFWAENQIVRMPSLELEAEETLAVSAQMTAGIIAYLDTPQGMQDFAAVYENNPTGLRSTLQAVYEWVASKIGLLPMTQRQLAQQRLDLARGNMDASAIEIAQQLRGLLDAIEPVKTEPAEGAPEITVPVQRAPRQRQKKQRGGKRREERELREAEEGLEREKEQLAAAIERGEGGMQQSPRALNAAERRREERRRRREMEATDRATGRAQVSPDGLIGAGLTPRFAPAPPVESEAFKRWFGDSKVVDADGKPLVVYHGTRAAFTEFSDEARRFTDDGWLGRGFYFTSEPDIADFYSGGTYGEVGSSTMPVYLKLQNPLEFDVTGQGEKRGAVARALGVDVAGLDATDLAQTLTRALRDAGYDGVIYTERFGSGSRVEYLTLSPEQIKSATGNRGTFDPENPDIRFAPAAWHGTPHEVDKFSTSKIGTGEGAQAFGYGLYFASRREVGEHYRSALTNTSMMSADDKVRNMRIGPDRAPLLASHAIDIRGEFIQLVEARDHRGVAEFVERSRDRWDQLRVDPSYEFRDYAEDRYKAYASLGSRLDRGEKVTAPYLGNLYQVNLAPKDDEWLLWDEPLSKQSEKVREAVLEGGKVVEDLRARFEEVRARHKAEEAKNPLPEDWSLEQLLASSTPEVEALWSEMQALEAQIEAASKPIPGASAEYGRGWRTMGEMVRDMQSRMTPKEAADALLARGIRGIKYLDGSSRSKGEGAYNYVVFDEADVEITGRFAPAIDDATRAQLEADGLAAPVDVTASFIEGAQLVTKWDLFQRKISDEFLAVKKYVDAVRDLGGDTTNDPLLASRSYFGRISQRIRVMQDRYFEPLWDLMREGRVSAEVTGEYVEMRHAEERNDHFRKQYEQRESLKRQKRRAKDEAEKRRLQKAIDKLNHVRVRLPEDTDARTYFHEVKPGSGVKTSEAKERMAELEAAHETLPRIGKKIDSLNRHVRRSMVRDGLLSEEQAKAWGEQFKHYVPLRTAEADKPEFPRSAGLQVKGPETRRAKGRRSRADNPLVFSIVQAVNAAQRGEKNTVGRTFYEFLQTNGELLASQSREVEVGADGEPQLSASEFYFKLDGQDTAISIENPDIVRALKRMEIQHMPGWMRGYTNVMRVWRSLVTSWNPPFVFTNAVRDYQTALINASSLARQYSVRGLRSSITRRFFPSMRAVFSYLRDGDDSTNPKRNRLVEYYEAGGPSGLFASPVFEDMMRMAERRTATATGSRLRRGAGASLDYIEDINQAVEAASRFALYDTLRDKGVSPAEAANAARELTVDFSQKGELGPVISGVYAFFSASVGGTRRMMQEIARSPVARLMVGAIMANGFLSVYYNEALSDDDEDGLSFYRKVPEYEKGKYQMVMMGDEPIKFIMPWGYAFFHNAGRLLAEHIEGQKTLGQAGEGIAGAMLDNYMPIGGGANLGQMVTPTIGRPFVELMQNENFAGNPIAPPINPFGPETARYNKSGRSTHPLAIAMAKGLNSLTGGDEIRPGKLNLAGDHIEHLWDFAAGGLGRTASDLAKTWRNTSSGKREMRDVLKEAPFIKVFYGARTEFVDTENFYSALDDIFYNEKEIKDARERGDYDLARELERRHGATLRLKKRGNRVRQKAAELRDEAYEDGKIVEPAKLEEGASLMRQWYRDYLIATTTGGA